MPRIRLRDGPLDVDLVFVDCDGVIFDINPAKTQAFVDALQPYPAEPVTALADYHRAHGGVSRYVKFRHFFTELHPVDDVDRAVATALNRYATLVQAAYRATAPLDDAIELIRRLGGPERVYVVSGSDQEELRAVFEHHGIGSAVADVLGSPTLKGDHIARVLAERTVSADRALMIGDGRADFEAAQTLGLWFVFLAQMSEWQDAPSYLCGSPRTDEAADWPELLRRLS